MTIEAFFAGWGAGIVNLIVGHPFDTGKVRAQTGMQTFSDAATKAREKTTQAKQKTKVAFVKMKTKLLKGKENPVGKENPLYTSKGMETSTSVSSSSKGMDKTLFTTQSGGSSSSAVKTAPTSGVKAAPGVPTTGTTSGATKPHKITVVSGIRHLYRGVTGPLMTVGFGQACMFGSYKFIKDRMEIGIIGCTIGQWSNLASASNTPSPSTILFVDFTAGVLSGLVNAIWSFPLICVKVRAQLAPVAEVPPKFRDSLKETLAHMTKHNLLVRGYIPHLIQEGVGRGFYIGTYTYLSGQCHLTKSNNENNENSFKGLGRPIAGACAGIAGWTATYPCDVIRQNMLRSYYYKSGEEAIITGENTIKRSISLGASSSDPSYINYGKNLFKKHGIRGLYAGLGFCIFRAAPVAFFTLPAYDYFHMVLKGEKVNW